MSASDTQTAIQAFQTLPEGALRVLQITDTHLYKDLTSTLASVNTEQSLLSVLQIAKQLPSPDLLLLTGDLVHDSSHQGYQRLCQHIASFNAPAYCLPGNHDDTDFFIQSLTSQGLQTLGHIQVENWLIIMLDSTIPHQSHSHFTQTELDRLETTLKQASPEQHILIAMHHHPVPINSQWMDTMTLDNAEDFFAILGQFTQIKGILFGHVHQEFKSERHGVKIFGSPSTCFQFAPNQDIFGIDPIEPGFRWLTLMPDGDIASGILRANNLPDGLKSNIKGY